MNVLILLSGGVGSRMGSDIPKQYLMVNDTPIFLYGLNTFAQREDIDMIVLVVDESWRAFVQKHIKSISKPIYYADPGDTRQLSILNGLKLCSEIGVNDDSIVIIHDAARPLVTNKIIDECIDACKTHDGAMPVIKVKDTIYLSENGQEITSLLNRAHLCAGQAPESFLFGKYFKLHQESTDDEIRKINGSTEIAFKGGLSIKLVSGDEQNFKITTPEDLKAFETIEKL